MKKIFEMGDRVFMPVDRGGMAARAGAIAIITKQTYWSEYMKDWLVHVKWDDNEFRAGQMDGDYLSDTFEYLPKDKEPKTELENILFEQEIYSTLKNKSGP
jgi:hypothetical protein